MLEKAVHHHGFNQLDTDDTDTYTEMSSHPFTRWTWFFSQEECFFLTPMIRG